MYLSLYMHNKYELPRRVTQAEIDFSKLIYKTKKYKITKDKPKNISKYTKFQNQKKEKRIS